MNTRHTDRINPLADGYTLGLAVAHEENFGSFKGSFIYEVVGADGRILQSGEIPNTPTRDSSIYNAMFYSSGATPTPPAVRGLTMLAVGTGATGPLLTPDAADPRQRHLNAELVRKAFASRTYRTSVGAATATPTNVVDFTTTFVANEAVGPINEMGLMRTLSTNPATRTPVVSTYPTYDTTIDLSSYDILINYSTFGVITLPSGAAFNVTWRLTF